MPTDIAKTLRENLAAIKAWNGPEQRKQELIQDQLAQASAKAKELSANDPETRRTMLDDLGAAAQSFADASTFGAAGVVSDALSGGGFQANRDFRAANKAAAMESSPATMILANALGALATPLPGGAVLKAAPRTAGLLARIGRAAGEGAVQGMAAGVGENIGTSSDPTGLGHGIAGGALGGVAGTLLPMAGRLTDYGTTLGSAMMGKTVGRGATSFAERVATEAAPLYKAAEREGTAAARGGVDMTPIANVLESQTVKPFADMIRKSEKFAGADEPTVLREAYKLMSTTARKAEKQIEGSPEHLAQTSLLLDDINLAKVRMRDAAKDIMPSLDPAILARREIGSAEKAFTDASDKANLLIKGTDIAGRKLTRNTPEAWMKEIASYTPAEAKAAYDAVLARIKDVPEFSSNPITLFNVVPSVMRTAMGTKRLQPILEALAVKAGKKLPERTAQPMAGRVARMGAGLLGPLE